MLLLAAPASATVEPLMPIYGTGTPGGVAGQLDGPVGVGFDDDGNLYVADNGNHRISVFAPGGDFVRAFGFDVDPVGGAGPETCTASCKAGVAGSAAGQLNGPVDVAVGPTEVYVADSNNRRISVFTHGGTFLRAFGADVNPAPGAGFEVCTASCQAGTPGAVFAGAVSNPFGIALDGAGNLFVVETGNSRVSVFTAAASTFQRAFGYDVDPGGGVAVESCFTTCKAAVSGGGVGQFANPLGLATDGAGNVFVADQVNDRIVVYNAGGAFLRAFGYDTIPGGFAGLESCTTTCQAAVGGPAAGQMEVPFGVGADGAGNVYVAEQNNARVSVFTPAGGFQYAFGFDVEPGGAATFETCTATCQAAAFGSGFGQMQQPREAAVDCRGGVYVSDLTQYRVQRFAESGTQLPPCPQPPENPPQVKPSNEFTIGKLKRNTRKGTAKLAVEIPGPGALALAGKQVKPQETSVGAGESSLTIKAKGKAKRKLKSGGKAKVAVDVTFLPTGGDPNTQSRKLKLKRKR
jgi:tripartite motif-containing protein 71